MIFQQYRGHLLVVLQPDHGVQTGLFGATGGTRSAAVLAREAVIEAGVAA